MENIFIKKLKKSFIIIIPLLSILSGCLNIIDPNYNSDHTIVVDGYVDKISYITSDSIKIYINAVSTMENTKLKIYDINTNIVREFETDLFPQIKNHNAPWSFGYDYMVTTTIEVGNMESGIYLIENRIPFIVKPTDIVDAIVIYPSNTINAYNKNEGYSFYTTPKTNKLSFHRQQDLPANIIEFFKWISKLDYSFGYFCDYDLDNSSTFALSDLIIIPGHNEYWTRTARENFDQYVIDGNDAMILSGNTMWWQIRYEQDGEQLICYHNAEMDPIDDEELKTINWHRSALNYPIIESIGCDFSNGGYGLKQDDGWDGYKIILPESPIFQNLDIQLNQIISIPTLEYDSAPIMDVTPEGVPVIDTGVLDFYKINLLGFNKAFKGGNHKYGTFIIMQKFDYSGVIINTSSTDWCIRGFFNKDSSIIKNVTLNMISLLKNNSEIFIY